MRCLLRPLLAGPSGNHGRGRHAESDGDGIHQGQDRLRQSYRSHRFPADPANEKNIHHRKYGFHAHLQDHGDGQKDDGPPDTARRIVLLLPGVRLFK